MLKPVSVLAPLWALTLYLCCGLVAAQTSISQDANFAADAADAIAKRIGTGNSDYAGIINPDCAVVRDGDRRRDGCFRQFTLSGIVTDSALPFATIVVHVGNHTFTTVADANGFYSLDIATATVSNLVTIEAEAASPSDPGETVKFINLAGTFSKLLSDPVENVTNVTTAQFALLVEANGGEPPTSVQELRDAETDVDATRLLELAAVIKLIVDDPAYTLPVGFDSIVEFIADEAAVDQFIADVNATDPDILADTIAAILADNNLVEGFTVAGIPSFYYAIYKATPGYLSRYGEGLEFDGINFSGTLYGVAYVGYFPGNPLSEEFDWTVTDGVLELSFPNPATHSGIQYNPANITSDQALIDEYYLCAVDPNAGIVTHSRRVGISFTRVVDGSLVDIASKTARTERTFEPVPTITALPDCTGNPIQFATLFEFSTAEYTLRSSADIIPVPFTAGPAGIDVHGSWGFSYYYNPGGALWGQVSTRGVHDNLLTFNLDGTGSKWFDDADLVDQWFTWQIVGDDLVIYYPDGWTQTSRILDQEGKQYGVFSDFSNGSERFAAYEIAVKQDFVFEEAYLVSPVGKFWNSVINHYLGFDLVDGNWRFESHFGWDFDPIPDGTRAYAYMSEGDRVWYEIPLTWGILPDGMLQRSYISNPGWPERQRFWVPLAEDPITVDPLTGEPISPAMRRFYVLEYEDMGPHRYIQPRLNIQQETDIPEYDIYEICTPDPWDCTRTP